MGPLALGPKRQEVHQASRVHRHVHAGVEGDGQHRPGHLSRDSRVEHSLVGLVRLGAGFLDLLHSEFVLLRRAIDEVVGARFTHLNEFSLWTWNIEHRSELTVAA